MLARMSERRTFFGTDRRLIDRIDSLDEKWFVEVWIIKYYFLGIEIISQKKEIVKHCQNNSANLNAIH
jgi:hypothetical protein